MKILPVAEIVALLIAAGGTHQKAHASTGLAKSTLHYLRAGRPVAQRNARRLLSAARQIDPAICAIDCGDRVEIDPSAARSLAAEIQRMHADAAALRAEIRANAAREFRLRATKGRCLAVPADLRPKTSDLP